MLGVRYQRCDSSCQVSRRGGGEIGGLCLACTPRRCRAISASVSLSGARDGLGATPALREGDQRIDFRGTDDGIRSGEEVLVSGLPLSMAANCSCRETELGLARVSSALCWGSSGVSVPVGLHVLETIVGRSVGTVWYTVPECCGVGYGQCTAGTGATDETADGAGEATGEWKMAMRCLAATSRSQRSFCFSSCRAAFCARSVST
eukprot:Sspe_Gene.13521::Locus_4623_Transcript_4_7_Confidence_0.273_Length_2286::g.13521::m.13521